MVYVDKQNPTETFFVTPSGRKLVDSKFIKDEQSWKKNDVSDKIDDEKLIAHEGINPKGYYSLSDIILLKAINLDFKNQDLDLSHVLYHDVNHMENNSKVEYGMVSVFEAQKKNDIKKEPITSYDFISEQQNLSKNNHHDLSIKTKNSHGDDDNDYPFENFIKYVQKHTTDLSKNPIPDNLYSLEILLKLNFDIDYQRFIQNSLQKKIKVSDSETDDDEQDAHSRTILGLSHQTRIQILDYQKFMMSQDGMSFATSTHFDILGNGLSSLRFQTTTHDLSKRFYAFIKKAGRKLYDQEMFMHFHIDDIIKAASHLEDTEIYEMLLKTGRISPEIYKNLPKVGRGMAPLNADIDLLITPEMISEFLFSQNLLNKKNRERFLNLFKNKPWFKGGGLQTLMQIIGGETLEEAEINDFIEWAESNNEQFNQLFSFSDMQEDMSLVRKGEEHNVRSKSLTEDDVKVAFMVEIFKGLNSADDPFIDEFFHIDLEKESEAGFYKGFHYREYLAMRGLKSLDEDISVSEEQADMLSVFLMKKATQY